MTDRRSVFANDRPDSRPQQQAIDAPVSSSDILGAHWTLSRQDFAGAELQSQIDAYGPVVTELAKYNQQDWLTTAMRGDRYYNGARQGMPVNTNRVWEDIARQRAANPEFMKDIPAKNDIEFKAWVLKNEKGARTAAKDVTSRESGIGQGALGFAADVGYGFADPINLGSMLITGGASGAGHSLAQVMAREALTNAATEVAELPSTYTNRARLGDKMDAGEMATEVITSGVGGAVFGAAGKLILEPAAKAVGDKLIKPAVDALADNPLSRAVNTAVGTASMRLAPLPRANDGEIASHFSRAVPAEMRTPDEQAALHVLTRQQDIDAVNPYKPDAAGMEAHAERLEAASHALVGLPFTPRAAPRPGITQDSIIRFVMHDLEGGAAVVPFSNADGGTTKYGIAAAHNPGVDVANLTEAQAAAIARRKYWFPELNTTDPRTAAVAFDAGYISGPKVGKRILRESGGDPARAIELYRAHLDHLADTVPGKAKFRKGWNNRVDKLARMVGDEEINMPRLAPERFADDTETYRATQAALDQEQLALAQDVEAPSPVARARDGDQATPPRLAEAADSVAMPERSAAPTALVGDPSPPMATAELAQSAPELKAATVAADTVDDFAISPVNVAEQGKPGYHLEPDAEGHMVNAVFRDADGKAKAAVLFPASSEVREFRRTSGQGDVGVIAYVDPAFRRQGVATKLYDKLRKGGYDIDELSGAHDLTPDGAAFVNSQRARKPSAVEPRRPWIDPDVVKPDAPARTDAIKFDHPLDRDAQAQIESLIHDVKLMADENPDMRFELEDGSGEQSLADILADLEDDDKAIEAVKGCL